MSDKFDQEAQALLRLLHYESSRGMGERKLAEHHLKAFAPAVAARLREYGTGLSAALARENDAEQQLAQAQAEIERRKESQIDLAAVAQRKDLQLAQAQAEIERLEEQRREDQEEFDRLGEQVNGLRSQLAEAREEIEELHSDNRKVKEELAKWLAANRERS